MNLANTPKSAPNNPGKNLSRQRNYEQLAYVAQQRGAEKRTYGNFSPKQDWQNPLQRQNMASFERAPGETRNVPQKQWYAKNVPQKRHSKSTASQDYKMAKAIPVVSKDIDHVAFRLISNPSKEYYVVEPMKAPQARQEKEMSKDYTPVNTKDYKKIYSKNPNMKIQQVNIDSRSSPELPISKYQFLNCSDIKQGESKTPTPKRPNSKSPITSQPKLPTSKSPTANVAETKSPTSMSPVTKSPVSNPTVKSPIPAKTADTKLTYGETLTPTTNPNNLAKLDQVSKPAKEVSKQFKSKSAPESPTAAAKASETLGWFFGWLGGSQPAPEKSLSATFDVREMASNLRVPRTRKSRERLYTKKSVSLPIPIAKYDSVNPFDRFVELSTSLSDVGRMPTPTEVLMKRSPDFGGATVVYQIESTAETLADLPSDASFGPPAEPAKSRSDRTGFAKAVSKRPKENGAKAGTKNKRSKRRSNERASDLVKKLAVRYTKKSAKSAPKLAPQAPIATNYAKVIQDSAIPAPKLPPKAPVATRYAQVIEDSAIPAPKLAPRAPISTKYAQALLDADIPAPKLPPKAPVTTKYAQALQDADIPAPKLPPKVSVTAKYAQALLDADIPAPKLPPKAPITTKYAQAMQDSVIPPPKLAPRALVATKNAQVTQDPGIPATKLAPKSPITSVYAKAMHDSAVPAPKLAPGAFIATKNVYALLDADTPTHNFAPKAPCSPKSTQAIQGAAIPAQKLAPKLRNSPKPNTRSKFYMVEPDPEFRSKDNVTVPQPNVPVKKVAVIKRAGVSPWASFIARTPSLRGKVEREKTVFQERRHIEERENANHASNPPSETDDDAKKKKVPWLVRFWKSKSHFH